MSRAVVGPSAIAGLTSIGGGAFTLAQSSRTSAAKDDVANAIMTNTAAAPVQRKSVRMFTIVLSLDLSNLDRVLD
jgi:hypothetical protein